MSVPETGGVEGAERAAPLVGANVVEGAPDEQRKMFPAMVWSTGTVTDEVAVTGGPLGGSPLAVAVSVIEPWLRSAWVTV